jgi:transcriptional regulator with XRE-family HTH domain
MKKEKRPGNREFRKLRGERGYSQTQLAVAFRVTVRTISRWETGERSIPYYAFLALEGLKQAPKSRRGK